MRTQCNLFTYITQIGVTYVNYLIQASLHTGIDLMYLIDVRNTVQCSSHQSLNLLPSAHPRDHQRGQCHHHRLNNVPRTDANTAASSNLSLCYYCQCGEKRQNEHKNQREFNLTFHLIPLFYLNVVIIKLYSPSFVNKIGADDLRPD